MDILYITLSAPDLKSAGIYSDLINALTDRGHRVTILYAAGGIKRTCFQEEEGVRILAVKTGKQFGVGFLRKGMNMLLLEGKLKAAVRRKLRKESFDLILYATPPVTFAGVAGYCRRLFGAASYLMLKDIFPRNAVDIGLIREDSLLHKFFLKKERILYQNSDMIGCMSRGNREYLLKHNPWIAKEQTEIFPNTVKVRPATRVQVHLHTKLDELKIPREAVVFVFGGNFGKPQGIGSLLESVRALEDYEKAFFLFIGEGSEQKRVERSLRHCRNALSLNYLQPEEYHRIIDECDVGIVSLDPRFTIPNYPSRILSYMSMSMPVLANIDKNTDFWHLIESEAACGLCNDSADPAAFQRHVRQLAEDSELRLAYGRNGRRYLEENFDVSRSVEILESQMERKS